MSNQPDHNQPRFGEFGSDVPAQQAVPERLSLMALFSTITGALTVIGCCIPAVGLVPLLLAIGGFVGISRSRGVVRGKGLAIVGGALGVISLLISSVLWIGASSTGGKIGPVYSQAFDADPTVVRTVLTSNAAAKLTDEQVAEFQAALAAEGVTSLTIPSGILNLFSGYSSVGASPDGFDQLRDPAEGMVYPFPAETSAGWLYVYVLMDPTQKLGSGMLGLNDAALRTKDGRVIWLIGPANALSGADQSPAPDQTDTADTPADESSDEDPEG